MMQAFNTNIQKAGTGASLEPKIRDKYRKCSKTLS